MSDVLIGADAREESQAPRTGAVALPLRWQLEHLPRAGARSVSRGEQNAR
jgi:hypothetical protein